MGVLDTVFVCVLVFETVGVGTDVALVVFVVVIEGVVETVFVTVAV